MSSATPQVVADIAGMFSWDDVPGHISYVLISISFVMRNIFWLRVIACVGLFFEIAYFWLRGGDLATGIVWDFVFIAINCYQLWFLVRDRFGLKLAAHDRRALAPLTAGLDEAQIKRIIKTGAFADLAPGAALTEQGRPVARLMCILSGRAAVLVDGAVVAHVGGGNWIGEIAFATGQMATATVLAEEPIRALALDHDQVRVLCVADEQIAAALFRTLSTDLADKLARSNARGVAAAAPVAAA